MSSLKRVPCTLCGMTNFFINKDTNNLTCCHCGTIQNTIKKRYTKGHHAPYEQLPKIVRHYVKEAIKDCEKYFYDIDEYTEIDIRNYWEAG